MNNRVLFPVIRLIIKRQTFEQFFLTLKDRLQRGYGQRLAETPRTDDELIGRVAVFQNRNQFRLVGVGKVVFTDGRKVRLSDRNAALFWRKVREQRSWESESNRI